MTVSHPRISCIICAFNEAPRLEAVLAVASMHPLVDEVIVVDDGSIDGTGAIVERYPAVTLITHPVNLGKSQAMATGLARAHHDLLLLLDADLRGLTRNEVTALVTPVLSGKAHVTMSLRRNSLFLFRAIGLDFVSGERVIHRELLSEALAEIRRLPRFGIEVFMNREIIAKRLDVAVIHWPQVTQARKTEKLGFWRGLGAECRMLLDLVRAVYPLTLIQQTRELLLLRLKRSGEGTLKIRIWQARLKSG